MSFEKTLAMLAKQTLANIGWKIDSTNVSQKIAPIDISWQIFPAYFNKKNYLMSTEK